MNYIGSKKSLLPFLEKSIYEVIDESCKTFCDIFAGTGIVGTHFKKLGYSIIANDMQYYSYVLNKQYIENHQELEFKNLCDDIAELSKTFLPTRKEIVCDYLSSLSGVEGFIYNNYAMGGSAEKEFERMYYSDENAKKCDAIRQKIEEWKLGNKINDSEYYFLLTTLLENIDKHSNTASVYAAFLKELKKSAQKIFKMEPAKLFLNDQTHQVFNMDANQLISEINPDILYLDPPYNQRQYAPNYHMLETIAKYDNPKISGKTGLRNYAGQKSDFCSKISVKEAFKNLIMNAKSKYIFLSYNNEGLMSLEDIKEIMSIRGEYGCFTQEYTRYKADRNREYFSDKTIEYLHYVKCN